MTDASFTDEMLEYIRDSPAVCVDLKKNPVIYDGDPPLRIGKIQRIRGEFVLLDRKGSAMGSGMTPSEALSNWAKMELIKRGKHSSG